MLDLPRAAGTSVETQPRAQRGGAGFERLLGSKHCLAGREGFLSKNTAPVFGYKVLARCSSRSQHEPAGPTQICKVKRHVPGSPRKHRSSEQHSHWNWTVDANVPFWRPCQLASSLKGAHEAETLREPSSWMSAPKVCPVSNTLCSDRLVPSLWCGSC